MNPLSSLLLVWVLAATPLQQADESFERGEFEQALAQLDHAERQATTSAERAEVLLLKGRCLAALRRYELVESVFTAALREDPAAQLDPNQVEPTVVAILEGLRNRLLATVVLSSTPAGATLQVNGKPVGAAPKEMKLPANEYTVEAAWASGEGEAKTIAVKPGELVSVMFTRKVPVERAPWWLDARVTWAPVGPNFALLAGGGLKYRVFSMGLAAVVARGFGFELRGQVEAPLTGLLVPYAALDGALFFTQRMVETVEGAITSAEGIAVVPGVGGSVGLRLRASAHLEPFLEAGYRYVFSPVHVNHVVLVGLGLRWAPL